MNESIDIEKLADDILAGRVVRRPDPVQPELEEMYRLDLVESAQRLIDAEVRHHGMVRDMMRVTLAEMFSGPELREALDLVEKAGHSGRRLV